VRNGSTADAAALQTTSSVSRTPILSILKYFSKTFQEIPPVSWHFGVHRNAHENGNVSHLDPEHADVHAGVTELNTRREMLDMATQKTRFTLIQGVLSHPEELPSLRELELMNPSLGRTTIHEHLEKLIDVGVIERVENHDTSDNPDVPSKFYGLTDQGREVLEGTGLFDAQETLKHYYTSLQKTEEHIRHENAPRP
jgi:DNA-binding HxlR family transcriptional regulator